MNQKSFDTLIKLHEVEIFTQLSTSDVQKVLSICTIKEFENKSEVITVNDKSNEVYCILSGKVRALNYSLSGREIVYDDIYAGGIFGEICALDNMGRSSYIIALEPIKVAVFTQKIFLMILNTYPSVAIKLAIRLATIIRVSGKRIIDTSTKNSRVRLITVLLDFGEQQADGTLLINQKLTHKGLAGKIGCTRETITRLLHQLIQDGYLVRNRRQMTVLNPELLREKIRS